MDLNWWKQSLGTKTNSAEEFQEYVNNAGSNKFIIVDFFMPACHYCVEFMPEWNQIVKDFQAEYGDQVEFVKVDGTQDRITTARYNVRSFPSFIILEAGKYGDEYNTWRPIGHRNYQGMKQWIKSFAGDRITPINAAAIGATAALKTQPNQNMMFGNQQKLVAGAEFVEKQIEEEKRLTDAVETMIKQQQQNTQVVQQLTENMDHMVEGQEQLHLQLDPVLEGGNSMNGSNGLAIFLAGISLGVILGIFFASYLVKLNRSSSAGLRRKELQEAAYEAENNSSDQTVVIVKRQQSAASMRTGSTNGSDIENEAVDQQQRQEDNEAVKKTVNDNDVYTATENDSLL